MIFVGDNVLNSSIKTASMFKFLNQGAQLQMVICAQSWDVKSWSMSVQMEANQNSVPFVIGCEFLHYINSKMAESTNY
jgi:hypothetical protein